VTALSESEALHVRVRAFARGALAGERAPESFDELAVAIAAHQARSVPGFRRLVEASGATLTDGGAIPAVPVDAFRLARVAAHPPELDAARFLTSGTTTSTPGRHAMRTTGTYRELSLAWGARALVRPPATRVVVALAPPPGPEPSSSLAFMMRAFMEAFDGRPLEATAAGTFDPLATGRWLASPRGIDVDGLARALEIARRRSEPALVLATGFALVLLLDALGSRSLPAPPGSVVMTTGGFKGKTREIAPAELARQVARALALDERSVVGEYGMTELTSQLYEGTLPGGGLHGRRGLFVPPPWLRVTAVDPETLLPVARGQVGIARFVDLGNVDSAVAIVTQDEIRNEADGIELLGRRRGSPARGCSLAIEEMVLGARSP